MRFLVRAWKRCWTILLMPDHVMGRSPMHLPENTRALSARYLKTLPGEANR